MNLEASSVRNQERMWSHTSLTTVLFIDERRDMLKTHTYFFTLHLQNQNFCIFLGFARKWAQYITPISPGFAGGCCDSPEQEQGAGWRWILMRALCPTSAEADPVLMDRALSSRKIGAEGRMGAWGHSLVSMWQFHSTTAQEVGAFGSRRFGFLIKFHFQTSMEKK